MRAASPHTPPTRVGWLWVLCAEATRNTRGRSPRSAAAPLSLELEAGRAEWAPWLLASPHINEDRSIQAALRSGRALAQWIRWISESAHPRPLTLGLGFGELFASKRADGRSELGGPAVENGRRSLWKARQQRCTASVAGVGEVEGASIASMLELSAQLRRRWTPRQAQVVKLARRYSGREVADRLGVGPSVVSESLSAASFRSLLRAEEALTTLLECYGGEVAELGESELLFPRLTTDTTAEAGARA